MFHNYDAASSVHLTVLSAHGHDAASGVDMTLHSGALAFAAAWPVAYWAPAAAGSGVPEVMAYLNGCNIPKAGRCRLTPG